MASVLLGKITNKHIQITTTLVSQEDISCFIYLFFFSVSELVWYSHFPLYSHYLLQFLQKVLKIQMDITQALPSRHWHLPNIRNKVWFEISLGFQSWKETAQLGGKGMLSEFKSQVCGTVYMSYYLGQIIYSPYASVSSAVERRWY